MLFPARSRAPSGDHGCAGSSEYEVVGGSAAVCRSAISWLPETW